MSWKFASEKQRHPFLSLGRKHLESEGENQLQSPRNNKSLTCLVLFLNKHIYIIAPHNRVVFFSWDLKDYLKRNRS